MWHIKKFFKVSDQTVNRYVQYTYYMFYAIFLIYTYYKCQTSFTYIFFKLIRCSRNGLFIEVLECRGVQKTRETEKPSRTAQSETEITRNRRNQN